MTTPSVPDGFYRAALVFQTGGGTPNQVVTWNGLNADGFAADTVATKCRNAWLHASSFAPATLSSDWSFLECNVFQVRDGLPESGTDATASAGTGSFDSEGPGLALVLTKTTGFAGRRYRGRIFLPSGYFGAATIDEAGVVDSSSRDDTTDRWLNVMTQLNANDVPMWLIHYQDPDPDDLNHNTLVTGGACRSTVHYLRRRQPAGS